MERDFVFGNVKKNMNDLKKRLKELRKENNLSQKELADDLNMPRSTVASWELGNRIPKISHIVALAEYYDVTIDYLLGLSEGKNSCMLQSELNNNL